MRALEPQKAETFKGYAEVGGRAPKGNRRKGRHFKIRYYRSFKETRLTLPNAEDR